MKYSLRFIFLYLCLISLNTGHCQLSSKLLQQQYDEARPDDFKAIQNYMNQYFKENEDPSGKKKWQRKEWYLEPRLYPSGKIENLAVKTQEAYASYMRNNSSLSLRSPHGSWLFLGPNSFTGNGGMGRINSIDIHPTNDLIIYLTSPSGGIWKTINGGNTWSNMTTHLPQLGFADLEIDHTNPNVLYALSGDGNPIPSPGSPHSQSEVSSIGVIKSIDGGITWNLTNFNYSIGSSLAIIPTKLLMHPTNPLIQFIAANDGIYKTTDGWNSNTQVYSENVYDIEFKPGDPSLMYASRNNSIYRSTMSGDSGSWNIINDVDFTVMANSQRVELAVSPDFPTLVYAMAGNWINGSQAFYASYLDGMDDTWIIKDQTTNVIGEFATYCIGLEVNPNDYNSVFGGGSWYWHSDNEGALGSWSRIGENIVHADVHDMLYRNGVIYIACDGGLYKSTDNGLTWTDLSTGLHITEIYRISGTTSDPNLYFIGAQDNGINEENWWFNIPTCISS